MAPGSGARRFKTLSEAVRHGCARFPLPSRNLHDPAGGPFGRGALHAAWVAEFERDHPDGYSRLNLVERYPELREDFGICCPSGESSMCGSWPSPGAGSRSFEQAVIHLEETHKRSREQVAQWLEANGF